MKKAQAAMEFLMTYGWAILVVLVAIGALAYFGVLSPEKFLPEKCVIATGSGLFCDDYAADSTANQITLRIKNILTETVTLTAVDVVDSAAGRTCSWSGSQDITADSTVDMNTACPADPALGSGDKVKADISITYSKVGGLNKTTTGNLVTTAS